MKRVLQDGYVSTSYNGSALALSREHLQDRCWGESICFLVDIDKVCLVRSAQASGDGMRNEIYTYKDAHCRNEGDDLEQPPEGEEDVSKHCEGIASMSMAANAPM